MTPETKKQLDESNKQAVEQIKAQQGSDEAAKDEEQAASDEKGLDTKAAFNDTTWEKNSKEATYEQMEEMLIKLLQTIIKQS